MSVTKLVVFAEEQSMELVLNELLPKVLPKVPCQVVSYRGKAQFRAKVPDRLRGMAHEIAHGTRFVVIWDRDKDDCKDSVNELRGLVGAAGFRVDRADSSGDVLCRVACEELEAWFFGDVPALRAAYPRVPPSLGERERYRDPDAITGGTAEQLLSVLNEARYLPKEPPARMKTQVARAVAPHMNIDANRSSSFRATMAGLRRIAEVA